MKIDKIDLDCTLVQMEFVMKGKGQLITIMTTVQECTDFTDWLNDNKALYSYKVEDKEKFTNKFYMINDYKERKTFCINKSDIKCFTVPFFNNLDKEKQEFKLLKWRA